MTESKDTDSTDMADMTWKPINFDKAEYIVINGKEFPLDKDAKEDIPVEVTQDGLFIL